ncbi:SLBB domain-containing protein [Thalassomonas haliotis]|uniref:SLBB domain-containing protein n=1 Tax=Thalassomonas haliotis TaxID=485448 RepID=A0ABY7VIF3_9GAMM|nr:SLBB domain-containing protein [Thalassomonas haliotis]WDE13260.1 SLBB domain-containing protein [Thalassomonas haliotis]
MKKIIFKIFLGCFAVFLSTSLVAANQISQQQIEQFKKLSPSQQRALAQSMGVDLNTINAQIRRSASDEEEEQTTQQVYPRDTQFDQFGNPVLPDELELEEEEESDEPQPFGYDIFANAPATFAPTMDIAIPQGYVIGSGDVLNIRIFGKENNDYEAPVSREGQVLIPSLGAYNVSGMTFPEMKKYLSSKIQDKILGVDVVITLAELRSMRVFVLGDAFKPGPYTLSSLSSITHAIFAAGGINDIGSLRNIQLKRAGKLITTLDLYDLLINGDSSNDIMLQSGDVVFISPVGKRVTIDGEVTRPAIYELAENETFETAIKMAGGLLPSAYPSSTVVERFNEQNLRSLLNIDLSKKASLKKPVQGGDYIRVMKTSEQFAHSVTIIGAVSRPGNYQWQKGQRITDLLPNINAYLLPDADLSYALVIREKGRGRDIEVLQFGLFNAVSDYASTDNLVLEPRDKILVFSNDEKPSSENISLESLALTKEELLEKEKDTAKLDYEDRLFWQQYGTEQQIDLAFEEKDELEEQLKLASQSLEELTGGTVTEELELRELGLFSRKRLLTPVIQQLKRQGASGEPIQLVEVAGEVKFPGTYPLASNITVKDLVIAAGGLMESAYLDKAEITRNVFFQGAATKKSKNVDLKAALAGVGENNVLLQSKDRLNVHQIPAWQENHVIELRGEFLFPGKYTIRRGETLGQLIERVGGFTGYAYINGSVFTREKLKQLELQNLLKVSADLRMEIASKSLAQSKGNPMIDYDQAKKLLADLTKVKPIGRLVIDLPKLVSNSDFDVLLEDGDVLYVPTRQNSINVIGQVQLASSHLYQKELSVEDYLRLSGGAKKQADEDRLYVIRANGSVMIPSQSNWFSERDTSTLSPGDTLVIPLDSEYMDNLTLWATATQIVYQAAVAIAAVSGI